MSSIDVEHGFMWTYVPAIRPNLTTYPLDLAQDFCGELMTQSEKPKGLGIEIGFKCRHGIGHAAYYVVAKRQEAENNPEWTIQQQLRPKSGFLLSKKSLCEAVRICTIGAPSAAATKDCLDGINHSYRMLGVDGEDMSRKRSIQSQLSQYTKMNCENL